MRTQVTTKTLYTYDELMDNPDVSESAKEHAKQLLGDWNTDYEWWEESIDYWKEILGTLGFCNAEIRFSGFCSQGDGASFTADVDTEILIKFLSSQKYRDSTGDLRHFCEHNDVPPVDERFQKLGRIVDWIDTKVTRGTSNYCHESTCSAESELDDNGWYVTRDDEGNLLSDKECYYKSNCPHVYALHQDFADTVESLRVDLCNEIYQFLDKEHDYLLSDEAVRETAESNEYEFDINGDIQ